MKLLILALFLTVHAVSYGQYNLPYTIICPTVASLTGVTTVNVSSTTTLATTSTGGSWSSSNPAVGSVTAAGIVTGVSAGLANISYTTCPGYFATVTVTVSAPGSIWNISASNPSWTYTTGTLTKNSNGAATSSGIATNSIGSGTKIVFGISNDALNTHLESIGVATASFNNANYLGATAAGYGLISAGNGVLTSGSNTGLTGTPNYGAGDTVYVAIDNTGASPLAWWSKGYNGAWSGASGNPATGVGGLTLTAGTYFPAGGDGPTNKTTLIFSPQVPSVRLPAGFSSFVYEENYILPDIIKYLCGR